MCGLLFLIQQHNRRGFFGNDVSELKAYRHCLYAHLLVNIALCSEVHQHHRGSTFCYHRLCIRSLIGLLSSNVLLVVTFNFAINTHSDPHWKEGRKEMFHLRLYGVRYMVKDHSDSERGNPLLPHGLLFTISSKGSFICTIPQTG